MARKPKSNEPQTVDSAAENAPSPSEAPAQKSGPKRTEHAGGIVSIDY